MNTEPIDEAELIVPEHERQLPAVREPQAQAPTTAAQAKTEAIANLTLTAYQKASTLQFTADEIAGLKADFPDEAFKPGAAGKENLLYVEAAFLRDRLDSVIGMGQWALVPRSRWAEPFKTNQGKDGSRVYVEGMLLIRGCFVTEAIGEMEYYPHNASQNYGDACEGAETACLRRCCKKLGVGLQAWKKDWGDGWWARKRNAMRPQNAPSAPGVPHASPPKPQPAQRGAPPATTPPAPSWTKRTPNEQKEHLKTLEAYLERCKMALLSRLQPVMQGATEYAAKTGIILPGETLADATASALFRSVDWNLAPDKNQAAVKKDFDALTAAVQSFMDGNEIPGAEAPWTEDPPFPVGTTVPSDEHLDPNAPDAAWRSFPMPWGKQSGVKLADLEKSYLYGLWANYTVETSYNGKPKKPESIAKDTLFREHLNSAGAYYEFTKKD